MVGAWEGLNAASPDGAEAPHALTAARWTPQEEFESKLAPAMLERVRLLLKDPFVEGLLSRRQGQVQQLCDRLVLSRQEAEPSLYGTRRNSPCPLGLISLPNSQ